MQYPFDCSMFRYDTFQLVKNKRAEQFARMCRLVYTFVVRKPWLQVFCVEAHVISNKVVFWQA